MHEGYGGSKQKVYKFKWGYAMRILMFLCQNSWEITAKKLKGAWSRGFRRFLVKTVLKLSVANFIYAQHCVNI